MGVLTGFYNFVFYVWDLVWVGYALLCHDICLTASHLVGGVSKTYGT